VTPYMNLNGSSGVASYEIAPDSIKVRFTDGAVYLYNYASAGPSKIEQMKSLARAGRGLNAYITKYAKYGYAVKLR